MAKKQTEQITPRAIGAAFASEQANVNGKLLQTLKQAIGAYTVENGAEYTEMIEGYGEQAKGLYNANTAKVRKSEFKKVIDHASKQETRQVLFNIIDTYESVQSLVKDLRALENGSKIIDDEGKITKAPKDGTESENDEIEDGEPTCKTIFKNSTPTEMIDSLEILMTAAYDAGYLKAADLMQQAMASIGKGEK
jgi:hypothetical protein